MMWLFLLSREAEGECPNQELQYGSRIHRLEQVPSNMARGELAGPYCRKRNSSARNRRQHLRLEGAAPLRFREPPLCARADVGGGGNLHTWFFFFFFFFFL